MASWHDGSVCSRIDLFYSEGLATCLSCGSSRDHPYVYEPIKQRSEIRLLEIQPGEGDDPTRGEPVIASTDDYYTYDAVSYTWADETGDATKRFRAFIGTGYVLITLSCQKVLQRIRSRFYAKFMWIDSLCVDQDNLQERGHQVDYMPRIYARAKKTYVYVGPTTTRDEYVLDDLATGKVKHCWDIHEYPFWVTLYSFLRRPYLFRVWVIQDIALLPNPVIFCSQKEYPWSVLQNDTALDMLFSHFYQGWEKRNPPPLLSLGKCRLRYSTDLPELLRLSRRCQATDHRDRVFALLGLVVGAEAENLVADYGRSTPEIFTWIARYLAKAGTAVDTLGNLNICQNSERRGSHPGTYHERQLPSWVPDWTNAGVTFLDRFPEASTYLKSLPLRLDEHDMSALILTSSQVGSSDEPLSLDHFGREMLVRPVKPESRFVLFQVAQTMPETEISRLNTSPASVPRFLMILLPFQTNTDGNLEVPGSEDFQDIWTYEKDYQSWCVTTFRFIGLLDTQSLEPLGHLYTYPEERRFRIT